METFEVIGLTAAQRDEIHDDFDGSVIENINSEIDNVSVRLGHVDDFTDYIEDLGLTYRLL